jgi:hypothetical protein
VQVAWQLQHADDEIGESKGHSPIPHLGDAQGGGESFCENLEIVTFQSEFSVQI